MTDKPEMPDELKPCPFCQSSDVHKKPTDNGEEIDVECFDCGAEHILGMWQGRTDLSDRAKQGDAQAALEDYYMMAWEDEPHRSMDYMNRHCETIERVLIQASRCPTPPDLGEWKAALIAGFPWDNSDDGFERARACEQAGLLTMEETEKGSFDEQEYGEYVFRLTSEGEALSKINSGGK